MAWTKILMTGDAAALGSATPQPVGTSATMGAGTEAARDTHIHDIGVGAIDAANLFGAGVVDAAAIGANAVSASELADDSVDTAAIQNSAITSVNVLSSDIYSFNEVRVSAKTSSGETATGGVFYDSDDNHLYLYVP